MGFRSQLESVLRAPQGRRVLDEAYRLARDPVSKQRIVELRHKVGEVSGAGATRARAQRPPD